MASLPKLHCNQCGSDWTPRTANPVQCPRCKRTDWNEAKKGKLDLSVQKDADKQ